MRYGNLRNYKKHLRFKKDFKNPAEQEFKKMCEKFTVNFIRKGYPDFIILDQVGEIVGFVEVKPNKESKLRPTQLRFERFCIRHNIPFFLWTPETDGKLLENFLGQHSNETPN